jgi:predicted transcriptional regulator
MGKVKDMQERRNSLQIYVDILNVARRRASKTEIVYRANLNFHRLPKYVKYLAERELIEFVEDPEDPERTLFQATEKGRKFLEEYKTIKDMTSSPKNNKRH